MYFIDTHAHLDMLKKMTPGEAVSLSGENDVRYIINPGSSIEGSRKSLEFSKRFDNVFAGIGIHPHHAGDTGKKELQVLDELIRDPGGEGEVSPKVVAVGETGFDFYRNLSPRIDQERAFASQIELGMEHGLPIIIHSRDASKQTLDMIKKYAGDERFKGVVHCFSGDADFAMQILDLGLFISFTGVITFPNAGGVLKAVKIVPMERLFIETDSPFLAPQAKRGKENYPGYVKYIAEKIAELKDSTLEEVADITSRNARSFFSI